MWQARITKLNAIINGTGRDKGERELVRQGLLASCGYAGYEPRCFFNSLLQQIKGTSANDYPTLLKIAQAAAVHSHLKRPALEQCCRRGHDNRGVL